MAYRVQREKYGSQYASGTATEIRIASYWLKKKQKNKGW